MPKIPLALRKQLRRIKPPRTVWRGSGYGVIRLINSWMSTLNYRVHRYEDEADPGHELFRGPAIFVFWHEYIPIPVYLRPHCKLAMLVSQHQDAEILEHAAKFAGLEAVRGSTSRGGTSALRELIKRGDGMSLAITPDGPRGPRRKLAQGCIYLSSRLQIPIIPLGAGYDHPWRNPSSWDKFPIPRPYSRCRTVLGNRIQIPADCDRQQIEVYRQHVENILNELTNLAEDWADRKCSLPGVQLTRNPPSTLLQPLPPELSADRWIAPSDEPGLA